MKKVSDQAKGWRKDYPDIRDFTPLTDAIPEDSKNRGVKRSVNEMLTQIGIIDSKKPVRKKEKLTCKKRSPCLVFSCRAAGRDWFVHSAFCDWPARIL